ncbi:hypothetical protein DXH78_13480 [Undibacter mobilis]|uniref:Uncharacterized protein n=2 Tax=Undibacter mobilis TaxID=2292256 RepID=A0A371BD43_9BRAD|nr:hypothetical protein DXH78_13480 [Undibacter mobilis]
MSAALAFVLSTAAAGAQTNDAPPEPAAAAQQNAPPAKIAPPMNAGERKDGRPETSSQAPRKPGLSDDKGKKPLRLTPDDRIDGHGNGALANSTR